MLLCLNDRLVEQDVEYQLCGKVLRPADFSVYKGEIICSARPSLHSGFGSSAPPHSQLSFIVAEFLEEVGLGEVTSTGVLLADVWLFHEVVEGIWEWAEERCFLFTMWPFTYFYPEHCRLRYQQITAAAEGVADVPHAAAGHAASDSASH